MTIRFYSIDAAPRTLPIWELILDDLGRPPAPRVARTLGVGASTVYRWNQAGSAPRMACLALFWLTRWGRSEIDCAAVNDCRLATSYAQSLESELRQAQQQLAHVLAISRPGSANDPLAQPATGARYGLKLYHIARTVKVGAAACTATRCPRAAATR